MTFVKLLGILVALLIILLGIALIYFDLKNKNRKKVTFSDDLTEKDGIPIIPRHLRKFSKHTEKDEVSEEQTPRLNIGRTGKITPINDTNVISEEAVEALVFQNRQNEEETESLQINNSLHHNYDIPPVTIQSSSGISTTPMNPSSNNSNIDLDFDTDIDIDTDINFDSTLTNDFITGELEETQPVEVNNNHIENTYDNSIEVELTSHTIHYTSGYSSKQPVEEEYTLVSNEINALDEEDAFSNLAEAAESLTPSNEILNESSDTFDIDVITETVSTEAENPLNEQSIEIDDLTTPVVGIEISEDDDFEHKDIDDTIKEEPRAISIQNRISQSQLGNESSLLNEHLEKSEVEDQNSPLANASDNINISILPVNEFSYISGEKLLQLVDDFGFKFGSMNMFHRYQNKDGTGILWFSMMGLTKEGIVPFDLNTLPTTMNLKGLVMFLPLPHPHVLQGFDSMMSIAGLLAREVNGYIVDEDGDEMTTEYKKKLRNLLQSTLID